jgi:tetratricopeptide (TPR) repeat protein
MPRIVRAGLPSLVVLLSAGLCPGQVASEAGPAVDPPLRHVPVRAATRQELDHHEALKLYGQAVMLEKKNRLVEALHTFEAARRLDPAAASPVRALIPIYIALDRTEDALAACRTVLDLDPDDCDTGYLYARQLRGRGEIKEAREVLQRLAVRPVLKDHLEVKAQVFFDLGQFAEAASDWAQAEKCFRTVTEVLDNPEAMLEQGSFNRDEIETQAAETWERLGRVCLKAGHAEKAVEAFQRAQKRDPLRSARLSYNLAEVLVSAGRPSEALPRVEEYLRTQPQGTEGYELKIKVQRQLGRDGDVVPDLEAASGRDPHNNALRLLLARELARAGRIGDAQEAYGKILNDTPSPEVYQGLFDLYKADPIQGAARVLASLDEALFKAAGEEKGQGEPAQAVRARAMLQVVRADADLVRRLLVEAQRHPGTRTKKDEQGLASATRPVLATLAARVGQLDLAEKLYRDCLYRPGGPGRQEHEVYAGLLQVLRQGHKYEAIVRLCDEGLERAQVTNRLLFHLYLAEAHAARGHDRAALAAADAAVEESGDEDQRLSCRLDRARVLAQAGKHEAAIAECQGLLKDYNQPGARRSIRSHLSSIYSAAHDQPKAEEQLQLILQDDPGDATANNDLGYLWADQNKNLDEAERLIRKALDLDREQRKGGTGVGVDAEQDSAAYVDSLGWVLYRRGKWEEARRELERAASLPGGGDDPTVWDHLADVLHRLGRKDEAVSAWKKSLSLYEAGTRRRGDGRYDEIKQKLRLLEP